MREMMIGTCDESLAASPGEWASMAGLATLGLIEMRAANPFLQVGVKARVVRGATAGTSFRVLG